AHSSTSISAALGMAIARDLDGGRNNVVAVIGDGAMSAGMAFEAINNAGARDMRLIVILNDNEMSIAPATAALSAYLSRVTSSSPAPALRYAAKLANRSPSERNCPARRFESFEGNLWWGENWFEEMGFDYIGPIDGHDLDRLVSVLRGARDAEH